MTILADPAPALPFAVGLPPASPRPRVRAPKGGCTVKGRSYRAGQFCPAYDPENPRGLPAVEIKGASYLVEPIPAGECGVSAVRLTKRAGGESYDVLRHRDGHVSCDCPSYTFTHEGKGTTCKHGVACMARGLLPVAPEPPAAEPAPAIPAGNPRDSWPAWTDAGRWALAGPGADDELYPTPGERAERAEAERVNRDLSHGRTAPARGLDLSGFAPTAPEVDEEGPAPSWDAERYEPEPIMAAYVLGFELGKAGEHPRPPASMTGREAWFFGCGARAGFIEGPDGRAWYADLRDLADRRAAEDWHESERIEAAGCLVARRA